MQENVNVVASGAFVASIQVNPYANIKHVPLSFKRLDATAQMPVYATNGAARFDLSALTIKNRRPCANTIIFGTGLAFEVPPGWEMVIVGRSGHGFKHNIRLANCEGVIDSDYRGEVMVALTADSASGFAEIEAIAERVLSGEPQRIAQGKLQEAMRVRFTEVTELSETSRGAGGFGHSGMGAL